MSNWLVLILRRLLTRHTILWGHAWPQAGRESKSEQVRHVMRLLSNEVAVYTYTQKLELQAKMPNKEIHVAPNALYSREQMIYNHTAEPVDIIFVSRMVKNKKAMLLLSAFNRALPSLPKHSKLFLIGTGPATEALKKQINRFNLSKRVVLPGEIRKMEKLQTYYHSSLISVSPGRVGLGLTQSLGFGVPMIIAENEKHGPEIEAANEGYTTYFFKEDSVEDLCDVLLMVFNERESIMKRREDLSLLCQKQYSIEAMAKTFVNMVEK